MVFSATPRRRPDAAAADTATQAYASASAQLRSFASPRLGSLPVSSAMEMEDEDEEQQAVAWMQRALMMQDEDEDDEMTGNMNEEEEDSSSLQPQIPRLREADVAAPPTPMQTPHRSPLLQRADTPVMSNSSSHNRRPSQKGSASTTAMVTTSTKGSSRSSNAPPLPPHHPLAAVSASISTSVETCKAHHDALFHYVQQRRSQSDRLELERQDQALVLATTEMDIQDTSTQEARLLMKPLQASETSSELDYLQSLYISTLTSSSATTDTSATTTKEAFVWKLVHSLRTLGLVSLIWDDDDVSAQQQFHAVAHYLQTTTSNEVSTHKQVLERLLVSSQNKENAIPLFLQRRRKLLEWIYDCLDQYKQDPTSSVKLKSSKQGRSHPDDTTTTTTPGLVHEPELQQEQQLLESCLSYMCAGQFDAACRLVESHGQGWRAAIWKGGTPFGYDTQPNDQTRSMDTVKVGNPHRFLWKRQVWKNGQDSTNKTAETAICNLLSNDVQSALGNPAFQHSWFHGVLVLLQSAWGRVEDEALHHWNHQKRNSATASGSILPYPGTRFERYEHEQLQATSDLASLTDAQMMELLQRSPFPVMRGMDCAYERCMAALISGKRALRVYCQSLIVDASSGSTSPSSSIQTVEELRFAVHFLLYLDSLSQGTTPLVLPGVQDGKNELLLAYVQYLASVPKLWKLVPLYLSLLPASVVLEVGPTLLPYWTDSADHRTSFLSQARTLLPPQLELELLRTTVRRMILVPPQEGTQEEDDEEDDITSTTRAVQSLQWLLHEDHHMGDALICVNLLLRQWFVDDTSDEDRLDDATTLVSSSSFLPSDLTDRAEASIELLLQEQQQEEDDDDTSMVRQQERHADRVRDAIKEYEAFVAYLEAYQCFEEWSQTMSEVSSSSDSAEQDPATTSTGQIDFTQLNETEATIARQRMLKESKAKTLAASQRVMEAADKARRALLSVLEYPGGWLLVATATSEDDDDVEQEEQQRQSDLSAIRSRYLVVAVSLYHQVCEETAVYLSSSTEGSSATSDNNHDDADALSPGYWYQHALDLANIVASDTHNIHEAFESVELQEFLQKLAETGVSKLMV